MTDKPRDTGLRDAFVGILMTVGPFFGVRYRPTRVEIPVVTSPATEPDEDSPPDGGLSSSLPAHPDDPHPADGIVL